MKKKGVKILAIVLCVFALAFSGGAIIMVKNNERAGVQVADAAVLKQGSRGSLVRQVQTKLKSLGYYKISVDGIFGAKTRTAVINFQRDYGLKVDGIVGTQTFKALGINSGTSGSYSSNDVYLLAKLIHAEARGEPYTGKVAVGAVVLNRVKSSSFPNTISGVIYQRNAFSCVNDGQINLTPATESMNAANDAINGWDPSYGSLYYYNPAIATSKWIFSRPVVVTIGRHVFAK